MTNPTIRRLALYWDEVRSAADSALPPYAPFSPERNAALAANLMVLRENGDGFEYLYYGKAVVGASGFDMTGRTTRDYGADFSDYILTEYTASLDGQRPLYTVHQGVYSQHANNWESLILPVVGEDGVRMIVCWISPQERAADLLDGIMRTSIDPIFILRPTPDQGASTDLLDFEVVTVNHEVYDLLGLTGQIIDGWPVSRLALNDLDQLLENLTEVWRTGEPRIFSRVLATRYGTRQYKVSASKAGDKIIAIYNNISELLEAQRALESQQATLETANRTLKSQAKDLVRIAQEREAATEDARAAHQVLADLIETIPAPVFFRGHDSGRYEIVNQHYADLHGGDKTAIQGQPMESFMDAERADRIRRLHDLVYESPEGHRVEVMDHDSEGGGERVIQANLAVILTPEGGPKGIVGVLMDVTEEHALRQELHHAATTDPLTGLANRRLFFSRAEAEVERCKRYGRPLSVVVLDIDHFKRVNDRFGHGGGDRVLRNLALIMTKAVRTYADLPARFGGEEFVILAPETNLVAALRLAERLREAIEKMVTKIGRVEVKVTASLGAAEMDLASESDSLEKALSRADRALYAAKAAGRNRVMPGVGIAKAPPKTASSGSR
ncbi:MAG: GGDEF domain-containing protein [Alphaproteobacteria bacterium]|nr:GGDEF domain-containing protein [Alphaproteobacteria bacterium]